MSFKLLARTSYVVKPQKGKRYISKIIGTVGKVIQTDEDVLVLETIGTSFNELARHLLKYLQEEDIKDLIGHFTKLVYHNTSSVRRAAADAYIAICEHYPKTGVVFDLIKEALRGILESGCNNHSIYLL